MSIHVFTAQNAYKTENRCLLTVLYMSLFYVCLINHLNNVEKKTMILKYHNWKEYTSNEAIF